jgi:hypothetical protein
VILALLLLLAGCAVDPGAAPLPAGDPDVFLAEVQPILAAGCGNPACHGDPARPFPLFALGLHRLDPADLYLDVPLSDEELDRNQRAAEAMLAGFDAAADSPLLSKPLAPEAGGSEHRGGVQFVDPTEADYLTLERWGDAALSETP